MACLAAGLVLLTSAAQSGPIAVWTTRADGTVRLERGADGEFKRGRAEGVVIRIDPQNRHQRYVGVGAALTDSAAAVLNERLSPTQRQALLAELFTPDQGIGLGLLRVTIGGSDFSPRHYSLDDRVDNRPDPDLSDYHDAAETISVRDLARDIHAIRPDLHLIASPWSAPAWMKSPATLLGGRLRPEYYAAYADYLLRFIDSYAAAGVPLYAFTLQNEPAFESATYASMRFDADERARFVAETLGPRLDHRTAPPRLLEWDHNWSMPGSPAAMLAHPQAARYVQGIAWHCYGGLPPAQQWTAAAVPGFDAYITECSSGEWQKEWPDTFRSMIGTVIIEGLRNGARGVVLWNLALDDQHGPHTGGCGTCRGVVTIAADGTVTRNAEYYALAHLGRFAHEGAQVISSTSDPSTIRSVALLDADGRTVTILLQNLSRNATQVSVMLKDRVLALTLQGGDTVTLHGKP